MEYLIVFWLHLAHLCLALFGIHYYLNHGWPQQVSNAVTMGNQ